MYNLFVLSLVLAYFAAFSQTKENFNTRSTALKIVDVKPYLQTSGWQVRNFDLNSNGWNPDIEGDGAMVSIPGLNTAKNTGIYSPVLEVKGDIRVAFKYKFNVNVNSRKWVNIYLTDANNNILETLDSVEVTGKTANIVYAYDKTLKSSSGFSIRTRSTASCFPHFRLFNICILLRIISDVTPSIGNSLAG